MKCDGTCAETIFLLPAKRTSPFKSIGASVQSTNGSRGVRISGSTAGYTMFRGSVKSTGYPLHSPVSLSLPLPCVTLWRHVSTGPYIHNSIPGISECAVVSTSKHLSLLSHRCDTETCRGPFCTLGKVPLNYIKVLMAEIMKYTELWYVTLCGLLEIHPRCVFVPWMCWQHKSPKRRYMTTKFHSVTSQKPASVKFFLFRCSPYSINLFPLGSAFALQYPLMSLTVPFYRD